MKKNLKELIKNPLFSGSAIMVIGSNSVNVINYLYHLVMGRTLGPSGYGELASLISLVGLLGILPTSFSLVIVKYVSSAKKEGDINTLIGWLQGKIAKISLIFFLVIVLASSTISSFLNIQSNAFLILIAITFLFSLQSAFNRAILQGLLKFKEMVFSLMAENITKLLVSVFLIYIGLSVSGAMFGFVIAAFVGWYITRAYLKKRTKSSKDSYPDAKSMLMFTIPVLIQSISTTSIYSSDVILVKHFFSSHDAGIYASLSTLGKIIFFATGPISAVMFPLVSQRKSRGLNYKMVFVYSFILTSLFAVGILLIYSLAPQIIIKLLYGSAYLEATNLLVWFGIFMGLFTLSSLIINYGLSLGKTNIVYIPLVAALIQIISILFIHQSLFVVVLISTIVNALLLLTLLIYLSFVGGFHGNKANIADSTGI